MNPSSRNSPQEKFASHNSSTHVPFSHSNQRHTITPPTTTANTAPFGIAEPRSTPNQSTEFPSHTANITPDNRQDDTTVGTTTSNFTRTTHNQNQSIHNARFQELEAQIQSHQNEFKDIHSRFDHLNEQLLRNMNIASTHSAQFSQLERQFSEMNKAIQTLLLRTSAPQNHHNSDVAMISQMQNSPTPPRGTIQHSPITSPLLPTTQDASTPISSPEKKRIRQTDAASHLHYDAQEHSAQYNASTPADSDI